MAMKLFTILFILILSNERALNLDIDKWSDFHSYKEFTTILCHQNATESDSLASQVKTTETKLDRTEFSGYYSVSVIDCRPPSIVQLINRYGSMGTGSNGLNHLSVSQQHCTFNDWYEQRLYTKLPALQSLTLQQDRPMDYQFPADSFDNYVNLRELYMQVNGLAIAGNIFQNLRELNGLTLGYKLIRFGNGNERDRKTLPANIFEENVNLKFIRLNHTGFEFLPGGTFRNNKLLEAIEMDEYNLETLPDGLLSELSQLRRLHINAPLASIPEHLLRHLNGVAEMSLMHTKLTELPARFFVDQTKLLHLNLSHNRFNDLPIGMFDNNRELLSLRLTANRLNHFSIDLIRNLKNLTALYINDNQLHTIQSPANAVSAQFAIVNLSNNSLTSGGIRPLVDGVLANYSFARLNLSHNHIEMFDLSRVYNQLRHFTHDEQRFKRNYLDLSNNAIKQINFAQHQASGLFANGIDIYLDNNSVECNCKLMPFLLFLNRTKHAEHKRLVANSFRCKSPSHLVNKLALQIAPIDLICSLDFFLGDGNAEHCPKGCECSVKSGVNGGGWLVMTMNCSNANLTVVPAIPSMSGTGIKFIELLIEGNHIIELPNMNNANFENVVSIHASNNSIRQISAGNLPPNVIAIDVTNNQLTSLDGAALEQLTKLSHTTTASIALGNNPWQCSCQAETFAYFLAVNANNTTEDVENIRCRNRNGLRLIDFKEYCAQSVDGVAYVAFGILSTAVAMAWFAAKFKEYIFAWLYAHRLCTCLIRADHIDTDRRYDAFISHSHLDEEFVREQIVHKLENELATCKLCIYYRDFMPGKVIIQEICESIENARRTIIVLSPNFLRSAMGRFEFQMAHANSLQDRLHRLIIIVYGDLDEMAMTMDAELKAFLHTNTYLKWGDPWFYCRLQYALRKAGRHCRQSIEMIELMPDSGR